MSDQTPGLSEHAPTAWEALKSSVIVTGTATFFTAGFALANRIVSVKGVKEDIAAVKSDLKDVKDKQAYLEAQGRISLAYLRSMAQAQGIPYPEIDTHR